jgi:glycosyltransferase involved in cell wall biosynthesis
VIAAANATSPILVACESVPMRAQALLGARHGWRTVFHILGLRSGIDLRTYLREWIDSTLVKRSSGIVLGCSRGVCEHMTERLGIDPERVAYFPNWIDPNKFAPARLEHTIGSNGHIAGRMPTICCVAGFSPIKQQDLLIRAVGRLRPEGLDLRVLMVGGVERPTRENYLQQCQDLAARLGLADRISFLGPRQDVPELLRQSDAFVFPSRREGLACALLEAMSTSLPTVAAAIHASYEVIASGENGFLFSPGSELDLAATIRHVFSLPKPEREQIGEAARQTVFERYTWEAAFRVVSPFLERHGINI